MKIFSIIGLIFILSILVSCGSKPYEPNVPSDEELPEMTLEDLAFYDGKEGRPAYIAVQGYIYDVSGSSLWANGMHNGYSAGQDLTDIILNQSPHGLSTLSRVPIVARLINQP